jgi:hypothetical protein
VNRRLIPVVLTGLVLVLSAVAAIVAVPRFASYATQAWSGPPPANAAQHAAWIARFPDCGAAWVPPSGQAAISVRLDRAGHPRFTATTKCGPRMRGWHLFEQLDRGRPLSFTERHSGPTLLGDQPYRVTAVIPYSTNRWPLVLAEVDGGGTGISYQAFTVDNGVIRRIQFPGEGDLYDLEGGGASYHGQGLVCVPEGNQEVSITQLAWDVTGNEPLISADDPQIPSATMNPPSQPIELTTEMYVLGGDPLHVIGTPSSTQVTTSYAVGESLERVAC